MMARQRISSELARVRIVSRTEAFGFRVLPDLLLSAASECSCAPPLLLLLLLLLLLPALPLEVLTPLLLLRRSSSCCSNAAAAPFNLAAPSTLPFRWLGTPAAPFKTVAEAAAAASSAAIACRSASAAAASAAVPTLILWCATTTTADSPSTTIMAICSSRTKLPAPWAPVVTCALTSAWHVNLSGLAMSQSPCHMWLQVYVAHLLVVNA